MRIKNSWIIEQMTQLIQESKLGPKFARFYRNQLTPMIRVHLTSKHFHHFALINQILLISYHLLKPIIQPHLAAYHLQQFANHFLEYSCYLSKPTILYQLRTIYQRLTSCFGHLQPQLRQ